MDFFQMAPPPDIFSKWIYHMLLSPPKDVTTNDPLICCPENSHASAIIVNEIEACMPCRMRPLTVDSVSKFYLFVFDSSKNNLIIFIF